MFNHAVGKTKKSHAQFTFAADVQIHYSIHAIHVEFNLILHCESSESRGTFIIKTRKYHICLVVHNSSFMFS